jgi:hypothetical protein
MENTFPTTRAVDFVYLVFITEDEGHQLEAYKTQAEAERARNHYHRRGFTKARIDSRAIRGTHYLDLIGA